MTALAPGSIIVSDVWRRFKLVHERNATLKEALLRGGKRTTHTEFWAVQGASFSVKPGEAVALVGRNGSGKSTLLKMLAGILPPQKGAIQTVGSVASMLELGSGFHPDFTGRENVFMNGAIHGLSENAVRGRLDEIIAFAELSDFIDMPVRTYSSGMQMRLAFAVASHVNPDILLLDEVLAVGDEAFQRKCMARIFEFRRSGGTLVFVSHDASAVEQVCDRAILMDHGSVVDDGAPKEIMAEYHRLLAERSDRRLESGEPPEDTTSDEEDSTRPAFAMGGWGTGAITITDVRIASGSQPASGIVTGDALDIELDIDVMKPQHDPIIGISINAEDGTVMYGTNTDLEHMAVGDLRGKSTIRFRIHQVPLHAGNFDVTVAVHSEDVRDVYHWIERAASFSVYPRRPGVGLVEIQGAWELTSLPGSAPT